MKATLVPDRLTPLATIEAGKALRDSYELAVGKTPTRDCLALLMAQSALETGRWQKIHCNNWGNVKAGPTYEGFYCQFRCNEVINGRIEWFDPPHPQTNFRAYQTPESGAFEHMKFLQKPRYALAWRALHGGMPLAFVDALKRAGYFTADEQPYAKAVASLWREYLPMVGELNVRDTEPAGIPDEDICKAVACLAPEPERWIDAEIKVLAQQMFEQSWERLDEARRAERDRNMAGE